MKLPTQAQLAAFGRHIVSYAAGAVTAAAALHLLTPGQAGTITTSVQHISDGVSQIAVGVAPLISMASGLYAAWKSSHPQILKAAEKIPGVQIVQKP